MLLQFFSKIALPWCLKWKHHYLSGPWKLSILHRQIFINCGRLTNIVIRLTSQKCRNGSRNILTSINIKEGLSQFLHDKSQIATFLALISSTKDYIEKLEEAIQMLQKKKIEILKTMMQSLMHLILMKKLKTMIKKMKMIILALIWKINHHFKFQIYKQKN